MATVEATKPTEQPQVGATDAAPAPVEAADFAPAPAEEAPKTEETPATEGEAAAPAEEKKEEKAEEKVVEPIYSGALGYKAPGLKNAFRFSKKYFWFGEEPVAADNLREYLRGEKPEIAHPVVAWSSQTGKGLLFFVKHADQKEHPAGVLNLAYATDLAKDGALAFSMKISGHKHSFEAQNAAERDGWFMAVEKAITEAKAAKDGVESSEGYKEAKESIGKPAALAGATSSAPKKSTDATPKVAEGDAAAASEPAAAPARAGSSSSSSGEEKAAKKAKKNKSRSVSRNKRTSMFGGLLGKKDKEQKTEGEAAKTEPEVQKEEPTAAPHLDEIPHPAPVNTSEVVNAGEEAKAEVVAPAAAAPQTEEAAKAEETPAAQEKPKPAKRGSIFGNFAQKLKSPTSEKKEQDAGLAAAPVKENEPVAEESKPLEEAQVGAPAAAAAAAPETTVTEPKAEEKTGTPSKERGHFSFGKVFGGKDRAKSPAAQEKLPEPKAETAPTVEDSAPAASEPAAQSTEAAPATEGEGEAPKPAKRASFFGNLTRSLSKAAGGKTQQKEKKDVTSPAPVVEEETAAPAVEEKKEETPAPTAADVPAEASVGEAPKSSSNPTVATTA